MYFLFSYRSILDVVANSMLVIERYYLRSFVMGELLVLHLSSIKQNFALTLAKTQLLR